MRKFFIGFGVAAVAISTLPLLAAFEAHVVNVTAKIENALTVPVSEIKFGTVFPQEKLDKTFDVRLSDSFVAENRVDDVDYFIRQKPKCWNGSEAEPVFGRVTHDTNGNFLCEDESFTMLPLLCPYLSKSEITDDGIAPSGENDGQSSGQRGSGQTSVRDPPPRQPQSHSKSGCFPNAPDPE